MPTRHRQTEYELTLDELDRLVEASPRSFHPALVGNALLHKVPRWSVPENEQMRRRLGDLVEAMRSRLDDEGIEVSAEPTGPSTDPEPSIPKRLRSDAASLAALLTYRNCLLASFDESLADITEGIGFARIAGDRHQESLLILTRIWARHRFGRTEGITEEYRLALDRLRSDSQADETGLIGVELHLRHHLIAWLLYEGKNDEAERESIVWERVIDRHCHGDDRRFHRARLLRTRGMISGRLGRHAEATGFFREGLRIGVDREDPMNRASILYALADIERSVGRTDQGLLLLNELAEYGDEIGSIVTVANAFAKIGELQVDLGDLDAADDAFARAERVSEGRVDGNTIRAIRISRLKLYEQGELTDEQVAEGIELCRGLLEMERGEVLRPKIQRTLALLLERSGDIEGAIGMLRDALETSDASNALRLSASVPLARLLLSRGKVDEAGNLLEPIAADPPPAPLDLRTIYVDALELLADIARGREDIDRTYDLMKRGAAARMTILEERGERSLKRARVAAEIDARQKETEFVARRFEQATTELAGHLAGLREVHAEFEQIGERLRENLDGYDVGLVENLLSALRRSIDDPRIEQRVDRIATGTKLFPALADIDDAFFTRLDRRYPTLTKKQRELCGMIRAGLSTAEIARLTDVTHDAIWKQRKRLRKRMELDEGEELEGVVGGV